MSATTSRDPVHGCVGVAAPGDTGRPGSDFYRTPASATLALLQRENLRPSVWEPACGDGAIVDVLRSHDLPVVATDLYAYGAGVPGVNFLEETELRAPVIVTNPPFRLASDFARHAIELRAERVCLLLRLAFLEGQRRRDLWPHLARVHVFSKRLTLWRGGHAREGRTRAA